jgi:hypothetical protein
MKLAVIVDLEEEELQIVGTKTENRAVMLIFL